MAEIDLKNLLNCALCANMCRCECPVTQVFSREAVSPAGKARLAYLLLEGKLDWTEDNYAALSACVGCKGCETLCPFSELELDKELQKVRGEGASQGFNLEVLDPYRANLKNYSSPYGMKQDVPKVEKGDGEIVFFSGCTSLANNPPSIKATLSLLDKAGVSYQTINEDCCGYPAEIWGETELARQLADENCKRLAESGASCLVTNCPECWLTFKKKYAEWGVELPVNVKDSTTYLLELIESGKLQPEEVEGINTVTYHDPCIWARVEENIEAPRQLLAQIPGVELDEANPAGANSRCCGGGQMFQLTFPREAEAIAMRRLQEFPGASALVTACPFCRESLKIEGNEVLELVELLDMACK